MLRRFDNSGAFPPFSSGMNFWSQVSALKARFDELFRAVGREFDASRTASDVEISLGCICCYSLPFQEHRLGTSLTGDQANRIAV
jgi:hypothetical protein